MGARRKIQTTADMGALMASNVAPISAIFAVRAADVNWVIFWVFTGIVLLGILGFMYFRYRHFNPHDASRPVIESVQGLGGEAGAYLTSLVLPLIAVSSPSWQETVAYMLCFAIYVAVTVNTNLLLVNPIFYVFGYKIWRIASGDIEGREAILISRNAPVVGQEFKVFGSYNILMEARESEGP